MLRRRRLVPPTSSAERALRDASVSGIKARLRREALRAARASAVTLGAGAGLRLADAFASAIPLDVDAIVGAYAALPSEIDPLPLLHRLAEAGHAIALPAVETAAAPLVFRHWHPGDPLVPGPFGTSYPRDAARRLDPDVLIVPLVAFDSEGYRLGRGGGFYDRTIEDLRRRAPLVVVGCAFAGQEVAGLPHASHDQRLDWIVTENGATAFA
jgi:5-formyltetrahydrofolate cyclo-ligase